MNALLAGLAALQIVQMILFSYLEIVRIRQYRLETRISQIERRQQAMMEDGITPENFDKFW